MLAWGEANMAIAHATIAGIIAVYGNESPTHNAAANGAVFMGEWKAPAHLLEIGRSFNTQYSSR